MKPTTFWTLAVVIVVGTTWLFWPAPAQHREGQQTAQITAADLDAVRALRVFWAADESGAPAVFGTLAAELDESTYRRAIAAAEILMHLGTLAPGRYSYTQGNAEDDPAPFIEHGYATLEGGRVTFDVTEQHLTLLANAQTEVIDDGGRELAVRIDSKRPYGDMTYFEIDMGAILGVTPAGPPRKDYPRMLEFTEEQLQFLDRLHDETQPTLQIFLQHAELEPGRFIRIPPDYGRWQRLR